MKIRYSLLFVIIPSIVFSGCGLDLVSRHSRRPTHKALAVAHDSAVKWAYGEGWGQLSEEQAIEKALSYCNQHRIIQRVYSQCVIVSVDDKPYSGSSPPVSSSSPPPPQPKIVSSSGTGFAIDSYGQIMTANHVIVDAKKISVHLQDGNVYPATVMKTSYNIDIAVIKINQKTPDYLIVDAQHKLSAGSSVFTFGFPLVDTLGKEPKFSDGSISSLSGLSEDVTFMQITVPVQPGNSGGPLVSEDGRVVGIITSSMAIQPFLKATGTLPQNINWAVNATFVSPLLPSNVNLRMTPMSRQQAIEATKKAVCLIRVEK